MKILDTIKNTFNENQRNQLEQLFFKKIGEGKIPWKDVYIQELRKRLPSLINGITLDRVPSKNKINLNKMKEQLEDVEISLISLASESEELNHTLSRHEMFRKDDVKSFFNISRQYVDIVNNEIKDYRTNNITVQNGIIELIPSLIIDFRIKDVEVEYFPDYLLKRFGNDPTPENLTPGTDKNYWLSEILTYRKGQVGAKITLSFNANINFNKLILNMAGKYPVTIEKVEVKSGDTWQNVKFVGKSTEKFTQLITVDDNGDSTTYQGEHVRLTLVQNKPDFVWEMDVNNEEEIFRDDTEKAKTVSKTLYQDKFELVEEKTLKNSFSYIFGLYYIRIMLQKYSSNLEGNFYSRKFSKDRSFKYLTINSEEYKPGNFSIEYKVIQHDGSLASINNPEGITEEERAQVKPNVRLELLDIFPGYKIASGMNDTKLNLDNYPIDDGFLCKVNGKEVRKVTKFDEKDDYQVIISKNTLFFNKMIISTDTVEISYRYYTDYVIIQAILKTETNYDVVDSPKITDFSVELE